jgi:hypothetical protein
MGAVRDKEGDLMDVMMVAGQLLRATNNYNMNILIERSLKALRVYVLVVGSYGPPARLVLRAQRYVGLD